jgi:hypothetical protein
MKENLDAIAPVIQLSVAPVFLLTGIGAILGVMTNRLARITDRARSLETTLRQSDAASDGGAGPIRDELRALSRRARLINRAITLGVLSALLICAVIVGLFVTAYYEWAPNLTRLVAAVFAVALLALIGGLLSFLREVYLATATVRFGPH